ncbi:hypothetical protein PZH39_17495, partial [Desulfovibrio desulfuricans]|nr:hypothetical protein [Desulfovibrio desulfuricans]
RCGCVNFCGHFLRRIGRIFRAAPKSLAEPAAKPAAESAARPFAASAADEALTLRLHEAEPRLSVWLGIVLEGVDEAGDLLWQRLFFLLRALDAPEA